MNARTEAAAREGQMIDQSQQRAIAARQAEDKKPRNALEAMAAKLEISPGGLKQTLLSTVFAECKNEEQFMALVVVSNSYGLNPLLKEIYAFPGKGGGIVPMVSVDGWIRLMNEHPQFDGIEFEYTLDDKGNTVAIEAIIYRKDRSRPIKVMEFMAECKGNTPPWQKHERRMLRHRALIQCVRVAFGFSGIHADGDEDVVDAQYREVQTMPSKQSLAEELNDQIPAFDGETGEIIEEPKPAKAASKPAPAGMTEVSEEVARELDNRNDGTLSDENPTAGEGPADEQRGEAHVDQHAAAEQTLRDIDGPLEQEKQEAPAKKPFEWQDNVDFLKEKAGNCGSMEELKLVEGDYLRVCGSWPKEICDDFERFLTTHRNRIRGGA